MGVVEFDKYSLIKNGKRIFLRSGSIHYFRTLGEAEWLDRLSKMKAGGYNCVDIYFYWGFHEAEENNFDFSGYKNVEKLLEIAKNLDLFVVARPGPFINAEVSAGGIPYWFLKDKECVHRNRIDGNYTYSPKYMEGVKKWYSTIIPIINKFDNVILFQIENEYSTNGGEDEYIKELYQISRDLGVKALIFHNDAYIAGLYADVVDIYGCDIYPYINPKNNWREDTFSLDTLDNLEDMVSCFKENAPAYIAEMQSGWYDKWLGYGYDYIREDMGYDHINIITKTAISQGITAFNHYMTVGGTNIMNTSSDEVYTSYDFAAPISEFGIIKENFKKSKEINYFLESFNLCQTERIEIEEEIPDNCFARKRKDLINNCEWLFVRNLNFAQTQVMGINLNPFDMKIIPINLELKGCKIISSGIETFLKLENGEKETIFLIADENNFIEIEDKNGKKQCISGDKENFEEIEFENTKFIFLNYETSNSCWKLGEKLIFNADFIYPTGEVAISNSKVLVTYTIENGFETEYKEHEIKNTKIKLTDFDVSFCAEEIEKGYDYSNWKSVEQNEDGSLEDAFALDVYSEFIWYKGKISNKVREISITARHIFAIYINGKELLNRNSYKYDNLMQIDEHIEVSVDESYFDSENDNEITILVQNLGFDRGFSNNLNSPRGLIYFNCNTGEKVKWHIRNKISRKIRETQEGQAPYIAMLNKDFEIDKKYFEKDIFAPFVLDMGKTPFRRATIYLNEVKIGRFIRSNSHQTKFYLPPEFLKEKNNIKIVIWEKSHRIKSAWDFKNYIRSAIINIEPHKIYQLQKIWGKYGNSSWFFN